MAHPAVRPATSRRRIPPAHLVAVFSVAATLFCPTAAPAVVTMAEEPGSPYPTGVNPYGVVAPDFNGDSRPDVATANGTASTVSTFLRQAGGGFTPDVNSPFAVAAGPNWLAVADFNGDERPDIAASGFAGQNVTVHLRQAGGGFAQEGTPIAVGDQASAIAAGDFTGDGQPDLAVARWNIGDIRILPRTGGGFGAPADVNVGLNPRYLAVRDFDGNGRPDVAVANQGSDDVRIIFSLAGPAFVNSEQPVPVGDLPAGITSEDFNGDGRADMAVTNFGSDNVSVYLRNGANNGFVQEASSPLATGDRPIGIAAADLDNDGTRDLAVGHNSASAVRILRGSPGGGFAVDDASVPALPFAYGVAAADFDADGRSDLAVTDDQNSRVHVFRNTTTPPAQPLPPGPPPPPGIPVAQFSVQPNPSCVGLTTTFDASASSSPNGPITRYRFEYTERYREGTVSTVDLFRQVVIADGPQPVVSRMFDWNIVSRQGGTGRGGEGADSPRIDPEVRAASFVTRDPADVTLTVTDVTGAQASVTQRLNFQSPCTQPIPSSVFVPLTTVASVTTTARSKTLRLPTRCPGLLSCAGTIRITKRLRGSRGAGRTRTVTLALADIAIAAGRRATVSLRLTRPGRQLVSKPGRQRVRVTTRTRSPGGALVTKARNVTVRVKRR